MTSRTTNTFQCPFSPCQGEPYSLRRPAELPTLAESRMKGCQRTKPAKSDNAVHTRSGEVDRRVTCSTSNMIAVLEAE